jgi:hypothetical protein
VAFKLEVNHPEFPKGWEFDMDGVVVKNGGSVTLTEQDELNVLGRAQGRTVDEVYGHEDVPEYIKFSGTSAIKQPKKEGGDN